MNTIFFKTSGFFALLVLLSSNALFAQSYVKSDFVEIAHLEGEGHKMSNDRPEGAANTYDYQYARCHWQVDPAVHFISGHIDCFFAPSQSGFSSMQFDLDSMMTVDSIMYRGSAINFSQPSRYILEVQFPSSLPSSSTDSVSIYYHGVPDSSGFGSFATELHNGNTPIMWTLSEPYGAQEWWPTKQDLNDKIDSIDVYVTCPVGNKVAGNGKLMSETIQGNELVTHWRSRHPIAAYLVAIAISNYSSFTHVAQLSNGPVPILNYVYPQDSATAYPLAAATVQIMEFFDSLTIPYPFDNEKYGHAQFNWGGGMEHQTMSFMNNFQYPLVAHELAHQWFGDHVTCGSWEDLWLNESFATYFEGLTVERFQSKALWDYWKVLKTNNITKQPGGSVFVTDTNNIGRLFNGRLTYNKGAYVLNMLRWQVGDSAFFAAIRNYLSDPNLAGAYARTSDLQWHMEASSGQNLQNFFDIWFIGEGFPTYQVSWNQQMDSTLNLTIHQTTSHPSVPFYKMPVPIRVEGWTQDTILRLDHTFSGESFSAKIPFQVIKVVFNHDLWLLTGENQVIGLRENILDAKVRIYPNPAQDNIYIEGLEKSNTEIEFQLFDAFGRLVSIQAITPYTDKIELDVHSLKPGFYLLKAMTEDGPISQEIIVN